MTTGALAGLALQPGWSWSPLGRIAERRKESGRPDLEPLSVFLDGGVVPRADRQADNHNRLGESLDPYLMVEPGDLVFNKLRVWQGGFGHSAHRGIVSPAYFVLRPAQSDPRFLDYLLHSVPFLQELTRRSKWMPPSQFDIGWEELRSLPVLTPPLAEQRRIADFLDAETARIDALITAKQQMIEVLTRRLGRALDDRMSALGPPSTALRRFTRSITQGTSGIAGATPAGVGEWGILKLSAVRNGVFRQDENKVVGPDFPVDESLRPQPGDLLVTRSNTPAYVGDACAVREDVGQVLLPDLIYRIRTDGRLDPVFASMALRTTSARLALSSAARGTSQSMVKLRGEDILNVEVPVPPLAVQREVVALHDKAVNHHQRLSATLTHQIELLREHRQALITAAVSGELTA